MKPEFKILCGDATTKIKEIPNASLDMCITSPPYYGLRDYAGETEQIGLEESPEEYVASLVRVFVELRRALKPHATLWINLGDSYYNYHGKGCSYITKQTLANSLQDKPQYCPRRANKLEGLKSKDLIGIPWMFAFAMRDAGFYLRTDIIWAKSVSGQKEIMDSIWVAATASGIPEDKIEEMVHYMTQHEDTRPYVGSCMPESVRDRCTRSHEYIFMFSMQEDYYYDVYATKEDAATQPHKPGNKARVGKQGGGRTDESYKERMEASWGGKMRSRRSVWTITPKPFKGTKYLADFMVGGKGYIISPDCAKHSCNAVTEGLVVDPNCPKCKQGFKDEECTCKRLSPECTCEEVTTDHYAVYPPALILPPILAGTSEKGVCPDCGKPWLRVVDSKPAEAVGERGSSKIGKSRGDVGSKDRHIAGGSEWIDKGNSIKLLGWKPGCECGKEPVPATVFDPFTGSGTTAVVALQNGRSFLGTELNSEYIHLATKRIEQEVGDAGKD
jgi:DNA modification methylase